MDTICLQDSGYLSDEERGARVVQGIAVAIAQMRPLDRLELVRHDQGRWTVTFTAPANRDRVF